MIRATLFLALPALSAAVLLPCNDDPSLGMTGVSGCTGGPIQPRCATTFRAECDTMYPIDQYSEAGIPCGMSTEIECTDSPDITMPNAQYPIEALDAVADIVQSRLVRGSENSGAASLLDTDELELFLRQASELNITFLNEGACDRNSVGFTMFDPADVTANDPRQMTLIQRRDLIREKMEFTIMFPNVDFEFCQCTAAGTPVTYEDFCTDTLPPLTRGTTMQMLPDFRASRSDFLFPAEKFITFFLLDDGFDEGYRAGSIWAENAELILFSTPELNDPRLFLPGNDLRQHAFAFQVFDQVTVGGQTYDFSDNVFFCFEDRRRTGDAGANDNDFEDLCFFITADPPLEGFEPSAAPTGIDSEAPTSELCSAGLLSDCGNVCCAASCGSCGGCNCAEEAAGADNCCPATILFNGNECMTSDEVGCIVDADAVCPLPTPLGGC